MGIDLTALLAGLTGGAQGLAVTQQQDEAKKRQQALDALNVQQHVAAMQKMKSDALHQQAEDYGKGVRQGTAPDVPALNTGLDVAAGVAGANLPGAASVSTPLAVQAMRQADPAMYSTNRFQQVNPSSYVDTTATPEAVADRARVAADKIKAAQDAAREDFQAQQQRAHEEFLQRQQQAAQAAADSRQQRTLDSQPLPIEETLPDGTKRTRYVSKAEAIRLGASPVEKAGAAGGQNAPQMAAAKANLESAREIMNAYEEKLKRGEAKIGVLGATEGALASSPTALTAKSPWDALMSLGANASAAHLQSSDPELARYMTAKKYVAEAILNTHKRPNQTQYEIEQELSGAGPNATPQQIDMGRERRDRMYQEVFANPAAGAVASTQPTRPADSGTPSRAQQLWDAAVAKHGRAAVEAKFGPRPAQ